MVGLLALRPRLGTLRTLPDWDFVKKARDTSNVDWHDYFIYDETSPTFLRWNITLINKNGNKNGKAQKGNIAGTVTGRTAYVRLNNTNYKIARVVWEMHFNSLDVSDLIDHKDQDFTNNKLCNLRIVDHKTNMRNKVMYSGNKSGISGVFKESITSRGNTYTCWTASWYNDKGKIKRKRWSINKYGDDCAFILACNFRTEMIKKRNIEGAGYTNNHGTNLRRNHEH